MSTTRKETRKYADRREYLIKAVSSRRRLLKLKAVQALGGKCMSCSYSKHPAVLDFHHVFPDTKLFGVSSGGFSRSWESIESEIKKCILVCANCHREIEIGSITQDEVEKIYRTKAPNY